MSKNNSLRLAEIGSNHLSYLESLHRKQALQNLAIAKQQEDQKKGSYQLIDNRTRVFVEDKIS